MKWLALLLVLANALYFGWRFNTRLQEAAREPRMAAPLPPDTPTLKLVSELDQLPPTRDTEPTTAATAEPTTSPGASVPAETSADSSAEASPEHGVPSEVCVTIGPFAAVVDARKVEQWLTPRAAKVQRVSQTINSRRYFGVYLEPKNTSEARANLADLERKGVHDVLLIQRQDLSHAISLGLFSSQDAVNRRLAEITKQGYQPLVVPQVETTEATWLRANLAVGYEDPALIPREDLYGAAVETIDCAKIADPAPSP
ncbi:MAG: hypothetical protein HYX63_07025 [Gammaproteobacteria bacterium]|nr:hypothetical protein [Gammaproteobacteria bacterium]